MLGMNIGEDGGHDRDLWVAILEGTRLSGTALDCCLARESIGQDCGGISVDARCLVGSDSGSNASGHAGRANL